MRWFKHMTRARRDEKLIELKAECGLEGIGFYWTLIETIAEEMGASDTKCELSYPLQEWARLIGCHHNKFSKYIHTLEVLGLVRAEYSEGRGGGRVRVHVCNLLKYRDEYSKKSGHSQDQELEVHTDRKEERELTEKQPDVPAPAYSAPEEREPVSTGESLNELEQEIWNYLSPREIRGKRVDLGTVKRLAAIAQKVPGDRQKELWKKIHHTVISNTADGFGLLITIARGFLAGGFVATTNNRVAPPRTANNPHSNGYRKPPGWEMRSEAAQYGAGGR